MSKSAIEWTDEVWNPVTGCTKVSAGCKHCYAEREWPRLTRLVPAYAGRDFTDVRTHHDRLEQPLRWKRPRKVFVNSMSDLFHPDVPDGFIDQVFAVMALAPQHTFQVLTKRPDRMREYLSSPDRIHSINGKVWSQLGTHRGSRIEHGGNWRAKLPLPNVCLGVSVENQEAADERIPLLLQIPAAVRFISAEPLLGPVSLNYAFGIPSGAGRGSCPMHLAGIAPEGLLTKGNHHLHWVIVGGESGPNARPMHPDWVRSLRDQCAIAGVPFLFKQWGEYCGDRDFRAPVHKWEMIDRSGRTLTEAGSTANMGPITHVARVGKKAAGRLLDGIMHNAYPEATR